MSVRSSLFLSLGVFLLCQCATKHQPIRFPATFQKYPEEIFSSGTVKECRLLEDKSELTPLEKKRLMDLYTIEAKSLKLGSDRFQEVLQKTDQLRPEVEELITESETLKTEVFLERKEIAEEEKNVFQSPKLKKAYSQVYQLWNQDENEKALEKAKEVLAQAELSQISSRPEWLKLLNLQFRIAHDIGEIEAIQLAYQQLKEFEPCSSEAANAALLMSLSLYVKKETPRAIQVLTAQCDPDESLSNQTRKNYWLYRFHKADDRLMAQEKLEALKKLPLPGYYLYLALSDRGENFEVPVVDSNASKKYLEDPFDIPKSASQYLLKAEERLKAGLKKDSHAYLGKVVSELKGNPEKNLLPLLYVAHLYRAAGNHLESMKTFSMMVGGKKGLGQEWTPVLHSEFLEMFPRPFSEKVSWLAKEWNIDEDFIYSIMRQESAFNPGAVSATDARGLMQLMPSLARSLSQSWKYQPYASDKFLFQAEENLKLSTYHLHQLQKLAPHYALMAAAYNAGLKRTSRWWKKFGHYPLDVFVEFIPVNETRNYVKLVLRNFLYYKALKSGGVLPPKLIAVDLPSLDLIREISSIKKNKPKKKS